MYHIQAKQHKHPPSYLTTRISPIDSLPEALSIQDYGVDSLAAGASTRFHRHDCDQWWIVTEGIARVFGPDKEIRVGPGDRVYFQKAESHRIEAITNVKMVWFDRLLKEQKREKSPRKT
jgi:mannose-6-phosphate isomerase-like protein (cupin superfamily)